ncbi:MAG: dTDP-4-dehydrorhamnose reductase [Vicinamibacteria bacterium]
MKILVTGATGLVGKLVAGMAASRHDVLACGRADLDVTRVVDVARVFREFRPDTVLHSAAYTDVDGAESERELALSVNSNGSRIVSRSARAEGAYILYVSSDYVFDGEAETPYREEHPPRPLSIYGKSKLEGERQVAEASPETYAVVRTGWVYGPGKGFVDWARARLLRGEELRLVEDQRGSPTSARELAAAMLTLAEGAHRGVFHYVNQGEASWLQLGRAVAEELGCDPSRIRAIRAAELKRAAPRPRYSALSVERYEKVTGERVPTWREALRRYLGTGDS